MSEDYEEGSSEKGDAEEESRALLCKKVKTEELTVATLAQHLGAAIEKADHDIALEAAEKRGRGLAEMCQVFLIPRLAKSYEMAKPFKAKMVALRLLACCEIQGDENAQRDNANTLLDLT